MINIIQRKAVAGAVNLTSDFDDIAINGMKNLSATLKALIFEFHEDKTSGTAVLQGLRVSIDSNAHKISVSSGVAVTKVGVYPFFVNATVVKELTPEEMKGIGDNGKYLVLRPNVKTLGTQEQRLVKTPEGTYEEQSVYSEQALQYFIELVDTPQNDDLTFGKVAGNLSYTEDSAYPILRLSRTLDKVTDFLDTATNDKTSGSLMLRDENGRAEIAYPSANEDITNKLYVDDCISNEKTARESADSTLQGNIDKEISARQAHEARQDNPHAVTKAQVGLGNCNNTADKDKQVATATKLATARTINIQDSSSTNTGTGASFDGSENATIKLPATIKATLNGNAATATKATQDGNGNNIANTYATKAVATTSTAGLMSADDKNYISILKGYFYKGSEDNYLAAQTSSSKYSFIQWT